MSASPIAYKSLKVIWGLFLLQTIFVISISCYIVPIAAPMSDFVYASVLLFFLGLPLYTAIIGFFLGWRGKKSAVSYSRPNWEFQTIQLEAEECVRLIRDHARQYSRMVPISRLWYFHLPVVLVFLNLSLPYYSFFVNRLTAPSITVLSVLTVTCIGVVSFYGGYRATSNLASPDFQLPPIREALWLAGMQQGVPNVSPVRIAMDKGMSGDFTVYRNPRVIVRISGFEHEACVQSTSEDLRSLSRVLCVLKGPDGSWSTSWLWHSGDRSFLKRTPDDKEGYYVRNPVPSKIRQLGVKDVRLVTENAIALILSELLQRGINGSLASEELKLLGVRQVDFEHRNC